MKAISGRQDGQLVAQQISNSGNLSRGIVGNLSRGALPRVTAVYRWGNGTGFFFNGCRMAWAEWKRY